MRIIIEFDSNNQPEIKKISSGDSEPPGAYFSSPPSLAIDAGFANIPAPEIIDLAQNEISVPAGIDTVSNGNKQEGIDAGGFSATQSDPGNNSSISPHQNDLAIAVSSGSALDAGIAKAGSGDSNDDALSSQENTFNMFDRSKAISAGEFTNPETTEFS